jgi:hypothetical protein
VKARFEPIVIPDAFASEGLGETVVATQPQPGCDVVTIGIGDEYVGYTPDEARAIGRALIAAADHIQGETVQLQVGKLYEDESGDVWRVSEKDEPEYDDIPYRARDVNEPNRGCFFSKDGHSNPSDTSIKPNLVRRIS